jgi:hypothetical protein
VLHRGRTYLCAVSELARASVVFVAFALVCGCRARDAERPRAPSTYDDAAAILSQNFDLASRQRAAARSEGVADAGEGPINTCAATLSCEQNHRFIAAFRPDGKYPGPDGCGGE